MPRVRKTLAGAHEVLTAAAFMRGRVLTAKARGEYTSLRGSSENTHHEYDNESILGSVMGVTQEVRACSPRPDCRLV
jgi:non-canonical poly(A) RNA polymerase PAPD5/7